MGWFPLALLATVMLTIINFGDKFVIESEVGHPLAVMVFFTWINLLASVILWALAGFEQLPFRDGLLLMAAGATPAVAGYFYFQAVSQEETSRIVVLLQLVPVFVFIQSVLFLGDALTPLQFTGFVLILVAAVAVSNHSSASATPGRLFTMSPVLGLMLAATLIISIGIVLTASLVAQLVVDRQSLLLTVAYEGLGYWIGGMMVYGLVPRVRRAFNSRVFTIRPRAWLSLGGVETTFVLRQFVWFTALATGPVSLITVVGSTNVFFAIVAGWGLTRWQPHIFKEDIRTATLVRKVVWAAVAFVGLLLIR